MDDVQAALAKVEAEIEALGAQVNEVVEEIKLARPRDDKDEFVALRKREEQLSTEKEDLRKEKAILLLERLGALRWLQITQLTN